MAHATDHDVFERALIRLICPDPLLSAHAAQGVAQKACTRSQHAVAHRAQATEWSVSQDRIYIVEVLSTRALTVCWSDPRLGRCAEQLWRFGFARTNAHCALSGKPISRGDKIFHPRRSIAGPANWDRMILASEV